MKRPPPPQLTAIRNALANACIRSLTVNPDLANRTDSLFTKEIKDPGGLTNQKDSGRCWLFAGLDVLRSRAGIRHAGGLRRCGHSRPAVVWRL